MSDIPEQDPSALTAEERVKVAMLDPAYRDTGDWRHAEAVQRVHELAKAAWPDPTPPEVPVSVPPETPTPTVSGPMVLTGRAARIFREAQQRADWREYLANPGAASPELKAAIWTPAAVRAFTRRLFR